MIGQVERDQAAAHLDSLWDGAGGTAYLATKDQKTGRWDQLFYRWPADREQLLTAALAQAPTLDVYVGALLHTERNGKEASAVPGLSLWAEVDGADLWDVARKVRQLGAKVVKSGTPNHRHVYVPLAALTDPATIKAYNHRLTLWLGADPGGWDAAQVLRLPGSVNHKGNGWPVRTVREATRTWTLAELDALLPQVHESTGATDGAPFDPSTLPDVSAEEVIAKYEHRDANIRKRFAETPEEQQWSDAMWYLARLLLDVNASPGERFIALKGAACNKATRDGKSDAWLWDNYVAKLQPINTEGFWTSRPELAHIRDFARARRAGPWATLGVILAKVIAEVPPQLMLPPLIGGAVSLNFYIGLVGPPGKGKGTAERAANEALTNFRIRPLPPGSGEGIGHYFAKRTKDGLERIAEQVFLSAPEINTLEALHGRQSSTLFPELRKGYFGELLGFGYADEKKRLNLDEHSYRLCLSVGIQPNHAGVLLNDADAGTPQRFLWLPTNDPYAPRAQPTEPPRWQWQPPTFAGVTHMTVCQEARAVIDEQRLRDLWDTSDSDDMTAHRNLARLKVAAALAILAGRIDITNEDWTLAETVMTFSDHTMQQTIKALAAKNRERNQRRARDEGERAVTVDDMKDQRIVRLVATNVVKQLRRVKDQKLGWDTKSNLRKKITEGQRGYLDAAIDYLRDEENAIDVEEVEYRGNKGIRCRLK